VRGYQVKEIRVDVPRATAVTALAQGHDGKVYAGLTGKSHVLTAIDPQSDAIEDLGEIFPTVGPTSHILDKIHNALAVAEDGTLFIGQGLNISDGFPPDFDLSTYEGGHIFSYSLDTAETTDYGPIVPMNAVQGMVMDAKRGMIYGYSIPDIHFFSFDIHTSRVKDYGRISRCAAHSIICAPSGDVYGAWNCLYGGSAASGLSYDLSQAPTKGVYLMKFDSASDRLLRTSVRLPNIGDADIDPTRNKSWDNGIDSWCTSRTGHIYAGTSQEGFLLRVDTATDEVEYLGKPVGSSRIPCLEEGPDGKIYGAAGFPISHLFSYDPGIGRIADYGEISSAYDLCIMHTMTILPDGTMYFGETDSNRATVYKVALE
jgi:hypothetical protein